MCNAAPFGLGKYRVVVRTAGHQNAGAAMRSANGLEGFKTRHVRQAVIKQDHPGTELGGRSHSRLSTARDTRVPAVALEIRLQVFCENLFIIDYQDLGPGHECCLAS